jgi:hypothetical protein
VSESTAVLADLARVICEALKAAHQARRNALRLELKAGDALIEVQERVPAGEFEWWLKHNCSLSVRTAQLYMQLARHRDVVEDAMARNGELSLRAARKLISTPKGAKGGDTAHNKGKGSGIAHNKGNGDDITHNKGKGDDSGEIITDYLRRALTLVDTADKPGTSATTAAENKNAAIRLLRQIITALVCRGLDVDNLVLSTTAPKAAGPALRQREGAKPNTKPNHLRVISNATEEPPTTKQRIRASRPEPPRHGRPRKKGRRPALRRYMRERYGVGPRRRRHQANMNAERKRGDE